MFQKTPIVLLVLLFCCTSLAKQLAAATITGELKKWHPITLTFDGPNTSETATPNPFTDYRLQVTFTNGSSSYTVPGYFAADGNADETSATSGDKWRVHFTPHQTGTWSYSASFRTGSDVALTLSSTAGSAAGFMDGETGSFTVQATDKFGRDHRGKGRLSYVGQHYLRFSETGEYFVKAGADAPENTLAYDDFDDVPNRNGNLKSWGPHAGDYSAASAGAYTWQGGKGSELMGAIKYLSDLGMNAFSFLTLSLHGDDENVFPHLLKVPVSTYNGYNDAQQWSNGVHHDRFDVSRLAQWDNIFSYADQMGMFMHFKTLEVENNEIMDNNSFGRERQIYYRELVARFSHHLAMNWNLSEEITVSASVINSTAQWIKSLDPYDHPIVFHTYPNEHSRYNAHHGSSGVDGASLQCSDRNYNDVRGDVLDQVNLSAASGKRWLVALDEPGNASIGVNNDPNDIDLVRDRVIWNTLLAGGYGVEFYYGYQTSCGDLNCQDHRTREDKYQDAAIALDFFRDYLPFHEMSAADNLTGDNDDYVFAKAGEVYAVYMPNGGNNSINLPSGDWQVRWFNPRNGNFSGSPTAVTNNLSAPDNNDWVALVQNSGTTGPCDSYVYNATSDFPNINVSGFSPAYIDPERGALAIDASIYQGVYAAATRTFNGIDGVYDLKLNTLAELDGESSYRISINGTTLPGTFNNPVIFGTGQPDYTPASNTWQDITLSNGDIIRVEFSSVTNGFIPEGNGTAFSRGRWTSLELICEDNTGGNCQDYQEIEELVVIEAEELAINGTSWEVQTAFSGYTGNGYLLWNGSDFFNTPGNGMLEAKIQITNPGTYQFQWRNRVGIGTVPTDFNDSWLRFPDADDFFGQDSNNGVVYPIGSGNTPVPEGAGADGWFKIYSMGTVDWTWSTNTSDNDPHDIYVTFNTPGEYTMQISGRSNGHLIDRIVLSKAPAVNPQDLNLSETICGDPGPCTVIGAACNDGNPCTTGDVYDDNCNCVGALVDSDNDGVCDNDDQCPGFNDNLIGTACNDNDPSTVNDVYTSNCTCEGVVPGENDFWLEAECAEVGSAWTLITDANASEGEALTFTGTSSTGSAPTASSAYVRFNLNVTQAGAYEIYARSIAANSGDDSYWVRANNGGWIRYNYVNAPNYSNSYQWDQVGDWISGSSNVPVSFNLMAGNNTIDFAYREDGITFDKIFVTLDQGVPSGLGLTAENCIPDCTPGTACDDGDSCTTNDVYTSDCGCEGTPLADSDSDGICDTEDQCPGFDDGLIGTACNDGDPCTVNDTYGNDCNCAGTPAPDSDGDGICDTQDSCPNLANNLIGTPCDDGDDCTINDTYTSNCNCVGTSTDSDNDGVCDIDDICPNFDDTLIGTACDDGDVCTINDVYGMNCNCAGTFADSDNDGVCDALDDCENNVRVLVNQGFDSNSLGNFTEVSGAFGNPNPAYENLGFQAGQVQLDIGGIDNSTQTNLSLGIARTLSVPESSATELALTYTLNVAAGYDAGEYTDVLVTLDGQTVTYNGNPYLYRVEAGNVPSSGQQTITLPLGDLATGNHEIIIGVFNNQKTYFSESSSLLINEVVISQTCTDCDGSLEGTACDDGDDCTVNDVYDASCNCAGTFQDSDGDGVCDADDQCPSFDDSLIGTACDDGDACTTNDVYTNDCGCAGSPVPDSDGDGICDAEDSCPTLDNSLIGTSCDDGDACTTNDVYTNNCDCAGTPVADSDNDGVCDADDQCPGFDDNLIGTACDDGDACTINDVYSNDCNCAGTPAPDSDGDGICDNEDSCPNLANNLIGTACDDGDACTTNDVYTSNCDCVGTLVDSDNDGVCDADDQCPSFDNSLIGTACDDGDVNTINDVYTATCTCEGEVPGGTDFWLEAECAEVGSAWTLISDSNASEGEALTFTGTSSTGSAPSAASARVRFTIDVTEAGSYEIYARSIAPNGGDDSYWVRANNGGWVRFNKVNGLNQNNSYQWDQVGEWATGAPDNNPVSFNLPVGTTTIDFAYRENGITFDKAFVTLDQGAPSGLGTTAENCVPDCTPGTACNDGDPCTINDTYDNDCGCSGTFQDSDNDGVCNAEDVCPSFDDNLIGTACNDGDPCTTNDIYTNDCGCAGTPTGDSDNDGICDALDSCPNLANNLIGTACNDGDACTVNDVYTSDCGCVGTVVDSDNDGVCDADDQCPGFDNNLIGTPCDDGDSDTTNDVYTSDCTCEGTPGGASGTITLDPIHAAYLQGNTLFNNAELRVENGNRVTYLQFDLSSLPNTVTSAELILTVGSDSGSGLITVDKGSSNNWTETNLSNSNKPAAIQQLGSLNSGYSSNSSYTWNLTPSAFTGNTISLVVEHNSGNDVSFKSDENSDLAGRPKLVLTYGNALQQQFSGQAETALDIQENKTATSTDLLVYPNPFEEDFMAKFTPSDQVRTLYLLDGNGRILRQQHILPAQTSARLALSAVHFRSGVYWLRLTGANTHITQKVVKLR